MSNKKKIFAVCGSTKKASLNLSLIHAIAALTNADFELTICNELAQIPHFNPDLDTDTPPEEVQSFRHKLRAADGVLICTPEYAMGVPGTLKNALDWTVSSCEFSQKPVALITASSLGEKAHASLLETLRIIESNVTDETQMIIPFVKTKVASDNTIKDADTQKEIMKVMDSFKLLIEEHQIANENQPLLNL